MKKTVYAIIAVLFIGTLFQGCASKSGDPDNSRSQESLSSSASESRITKEMAYEGVNNYCHSAYDWSAAKDNPSIMSVELGEETENEYQVVFRSYTGAFVYFYVDKTNGTARMVEYDPTLSIESEAGTIDLYDYIE